MFQFGFNDCKLDDIRNDLLVKYLTQTLKHFNLTKNKFPSLIDGILTDRYPSKILLNNLDFTLADCINYLDREIKRIALVHFNKYPIDEYLEITDFNSLTENGYTISVNEKEYDAINIKLLQENDGILFSLAIHRDLEKNIINIKDAEKNVFEILNLFGQDSNTSFIEDFIKDDLIKRTNGFNKLIALVDDCFYCYRFKKDFENLNSVAQNFLLKEIEYAINRKAKTRFYPDDKLIKDVTPENEKAIKVFELRIYSPIALRMYFYESPTAIYFASIEGKPKKKVQDQDILNAVSIIKELMI